MPIATLGTFAFLPVVVGVRRLGKAKTPRDTWVAAAMVLGTVFIWGWMFASGSLTASATDPSQGASSSSTAAPSPSPTPGDDPSTEPPPEPMELFAGFVLIALMAGGTVEAVRLHRTGITAVSTPSLPAPPAPRASAQLGAATAAEERRRESRRIVAEDPIEAVRLQIGRPDLPGRTWDDGGLVDVNSLGATELARHLRLTPEQAVSLVAGRNKLGGRFAFNSEVEIYGDLDAATMRRIEDYLLLS